jgi:hypothetical protein
MAPDAGRGENMEAWTAPFRRARRFASLDSLNPNVDDNVRSPTVVT